MNADAAAGQVAGLFEQALGGDRRALGRLLTQVERGGPPADAVATAAWPLAGGAHIVGITGAPGVGKSTLCDGLAKAATSDGRRVAILAVDPSSPLTGGAILGDRIRMPSAASHDGPFVRSMASRGQSGGLALAALAAVRLLDATGHDLIVVETVGIGQVETDIARTADTTIVVVSPGWGDAVQANKAGLLEMAEILVVNKADRAGAGDARRDLEHMLDLGHRGEWRPPVTLTAATDGEGIDELYKNVQGHRRHLTETGPRVDGRARQAAEEVRCHLHHWGDLTVDQPSEETEALFADVAAGRLAPSAAARTLLAGIEPGTAGEVIGA
ncbi:MAG: methylmalonyl Co-A mutase-associated GTPase MeaB [Acidimicrobiia bacterium]|nr:methylmalonyl Co-A mutase-associated GTPase MeaB [Acidimicrobiia bacterium]MYE68329.1 methylmalonyl Co-A mutase-associated GTPase MeaB [Acidimicrobiia bacterium]MYJ14796.1 methylmalonyl Co-A mutase-associated GTPase MeaB [Acidimicrobiia bacterium]